MTLRATTARRRRDARASRRRVGALLRAGDLVVLAGDLGAGKTVFAQGIARRARRRPSRWRARRSRSCRSTTGRLPLAHVDVYRLDHIQELHDLGFDELVDDDAVTVVEWGDACAPRCPRDRLDVRHRRPATADDDARGSVELAASRAAPARGRRAATALAPSVREPR